MAMQNIGTIHLSIHLGQPVTFDVKADPSPTAVPSDCHFTGGGMGTGDTAFLQELLAKISAAYGNGSAVSLCIQGTKVRRDADCP